MSRTTRSGQSPTGRAAGILAERSTPVSLRADLRTLREQLGAPAMSIGEMVGEAAADPSRLEGQLEGRKRTKDVTDYALYDSIPAEIIKAPVRGLLTFDDVAMGRTPTHVMDESGEMAPNPEMVAGMADLAGSLTVGAGVMPDPSDLRMGIKAYHGTPHDFDRFSLDKIGTGEGAQAYGHGLYFAENKEVAKQYRNQLTRSAPRKVTFGKQTFSEGENDIADYVLGVARGALGDKMKTPKAALEEAWKSVEYNFPPERVPEVKSVLSGWMGQKAKFSQPGRLYEVDIKAELDQFLDWDAPLAKQPAKVQDALRSALDERYGSGFFDEFATTGADVRDLQQNFDDLTPAELAGMLRGKGAIGIRYLDANSRTAGDGSRNLVVFDDSIVDIRSKNGVAPKTARVTTGLLDAPNDVSDDVLRRAYEARAQQMELPAKKRIKADPDRVRFLDRDERAKRSDGLL